MLKMLYRLKRKHGTVLFAVIAVMSLLIAMASAAYYTARASYNTVVSNYDHSQLYISAISAADMVTEAIMNSASSTGEQSPYNKNGAATANQFKPLQDKIKNDLQFKGDKVTARTPNIGIAIDATTDPQLVLGNMDTDNPAIEGALDGLTVVVELMKDPDTVTSKEITPPSYPKYHHLWEQEDIFSYKVTTTAYYRGEYVTVEDILTVDRWRRQDKTDFAQEEVDDYVIVTIQHDAEYETIKIPKGSNTAFNTFFTATAQELNDDGSIGRTDTRVVKINTDLISDDTYFESERTYIGQDGNNRKGEFVGGITTSGSLYLNKAEYNISGNDNDWFIGKDLVIGHANAKSLNVGKENNIYIGKDFVINTEANITAKDIYIKGDLYLLGQSTINANVHVDGNIYYSTEAGGTNALKAAAADGINLQESGNKNPSRINGTLDVNGNINTDGTGNQWSSGYTHVEVNSSNGSVELKPTTNANANTVASGNAASSANGINRWNPDKTEVKYHSTVTDKNNDQFNREEHTGSVSDAMSSTIGALEQSDYNNITSPQTAYDSKLTIDFSTLQPVMEGDPPVVTGYKSEINFTDSSGNMQTATIEKGPGQQDEVTVSIPYVRTGVTLDIPGDKMTGGDMNGNNNIRFEIGAGQSKSDPAMPIVLAPNTNATTDQWGNTYNDSSKDNNAFSWKGDNYGSNSFTTEVAVVGQGNVVFETANVEKSTGKLIPYDSTKNSKISPVEYISGAKTMVGTAEQIEYLKEKNNQAEYKQSDVNGMLKPGTSVPGTGYENRVMLVSNAHASSAVRITSFQSILCGYVYTPNGIMNAPKVEDRVPIFGGMIVSTYNVNEGNYVYAEPKPSAIEDMVGSMVGSIGGGGGYEEVKKLIKEAYEEVINHKVGSHWETVSEESKSPFRDSPRKDQADKWVDAGSNYIG